MNNGPFQSPPHSDLQALSQNALCPESGSGSCHKPSSVSSSMPPAFQHVGHISGNCTSNPGNRKGSPGPLGMWPRLCHLESLSSVTLNSLGPTNSLNVSSYQYHPKGAGVSCCWQRLWETHGQVSPGSPHPFPPLLPELHLALL